MEVSERISYNRLALVGAVAMLLLFPYVAVTGWKGPPGLGAGVDEFAVYFAAHGPAVQMMTLVVAFHALSRLLFAAGLCSVLRQAEGAGKPLTTFAMACATVDTAIEIVGYGLLGTAAWLAGVEPGVLAALGVAARHLIILHNVSLALFAGAASVVILRTGVLPRWIGWIGIAFTVVYWASALRLASSMDVLNALGSVAALLIFTPWMLASAIVLFRRARAETGRIVA